MSEWLITRVQLLNGGGRRWKQDVELLLLLNNLLSFALKMAWVLPKHVCNKEICCLLEDIEEFVTYNLLASAIENASTFDQLKRG